MDQLAASGPSSCRLAFRIDELREVAGISRRTAFEEMDAGRLRAKKRGSDTLILLEDLVTYLRGLPDREVRGV